MTGLAGRKEVAVVEADLARKEPILIEFGIIGAAEWIHLVGVAT
ncbi:MAG TPA: hypothetical protein VHL31_24385 [Geminicoccus sp.]|jgi:hypothetical protein|nr:hypothetical protein [Geminicoccus sp.]HEX2529419.1 hypothetical protein [Geminicoccus sp.]